MKHPALTRDCRPEPPRPNSVWITGANGLIGSHLLQAAPPVPVLALTRAELDLTDAAAIRRLFAVQPPSLLIHCAALSTSRGCQADPALARKVNVEATALLAELAAGIPFVFFSTDLVFDGRAGNYSETDRVNPLSVYGETKVAAEQVVLANPRHLVIRTSLNCGTSRAGDRGLDEQLRTAWNRGELLRLFTDEFRCPIPAAATARATWELIAKNQCGLFHVAGSERLSRWEIGTLLAARWPELHPRFERASLKEYEGAPRSPDTSLNCAKVQKSLSFPLPRFSDWVAAGGE